MFERRQRNVSALHFSQSRRVLQSNEQVPVRSGLIDQILACRLEAARSSLEGEISPSSEAAEASPENID